MFKYETDLTISLEDMVDEIVEDIVNTKLTDENKKEWLKYPEYDHFGRGMWIRNEYLWGRVLPLYCVQPDDISELVFNKVIECLNN